MYDDYYSNGYGQEIFNQIIEERKNIFNSDVIRALVIGLLVFLTLRFSRFLGRNFTYAIVFAIVFFDLFNINNRYIDKDLFIDKTINTYQKSEIDNDILLDTLEFRVFNIPLDCQMPIHHIFIIQLIVTMLQNSKDLKTIIIFYLFMIIKNCLIR